jgi:lysophospholipase L1-like esterase
MKGKTKAGLIGVGLAAGAAMAALLEAGRRYEWGPFFWLNFKEREKEIVETYDSSDRKGEIIFYGASNFRRWEEMEEDMKPFAVQNHGFGGSTDAELLRSARRLLYPYGPAIIVLQTGSNDCARMYSRRSRLFERVLSRKIRMLETFRQAMPDACIVVISGILMPGRRQYDGIIKRINQAVKGYASQADRVYYVDAEDMTIDGNGRHRKDMFIEDGVHLTHEARRLWADKYIKPALDKVINDHPELAYLKR